MVGNLPDLNEAAVDASPSRNEAGYLAFRLGGFTFSRDEYFVHVEWRAGDRKLSHTMSADVFLRAVSRVTTRSPMHQVSLSRSASTSSGASSGST